MDEREKRQENDLFAFLPSIPMVPGDKREVIRDRRLEHVANIAF